jgi:hypothetical protein
MPKSLAGFVLSTDDADVRRSMGAQALWKALGTTWRIGRLAAFHLCLSAQSADKTRTKLFLETFLDPEPNVFAASNCMIL